ncbi:hypothetical protein IQ247_21930 [Plectonema cf. radiosum LEGE 06105]|uniref:Uncharacterized protein n=1 Tax=Plectonema cf. radiosum LEGE 06105 TaxID=945769 RepID=A0A8J7K3H5_9CYAN|nr:hypothetical protein [Plectonema radiosum]MBE9215287.1 hypothetical protein [Plectonema cf. radiosum LEGE 06105]
MSLKKIKGFWMIVSAFIPIFWIIICISIFFDMSHLINSTVNQINSTFIGIVSTLEQTTDSLNISVEPIGNLETTLSQVSQRIVTIPVEIKIPEIKIPDTKLPIKLPSIPGFDIPVPGLKDTKNILAENFVILSKINEAIGNIPDIRQIQGYYQEMLLEVQDLAKDLQIIAIKILALILFGAAIIIPLLIRLLITPYLKWTHARVRKGWELISNS